MANSNQLHMNLEIQYWIHPEEDEEGKKKETSDGLQLVGAVINFVKELPEEIRQDIPGHMNQLLEKVLVAMVTSLFTL